MGGERGFDEGFGEVVDQAAAHQVIERRIGEHVGQSVGAQQEPVARLHDAGGGVGLDRALKADRLREDVAVGEQARELRRESAGVDLLLHHGVVAREALELSVPA